MKKAKKSRLTGIPAWALSSMALVVLMILLAFLEDPKSPDHSTVQIIGYTFCVILISGACFFICWLYPKSVWYTPVICNAVSIMGIIVYVFTNLSPLSEFMFWVSFGVISVIGAFVGAKIGRRRIIQS